MLQPGKYRDENDYCLAPCRGSIVAAMRGQEYSGIAARDGGWLLVI